ncbi:hypothetical protein R6Q57_018442 [Mikania cordata]
MPNVNTSVDDLLLKSDRRFEFTIGSNKPVQLAADPVLTELNDSDNSDVCAESLSISGSKEKKEQKSANRSTDCSTSHNKSHFVPIVDFVGRFESITVKPNEMIKDFKTKFAKINDDVKKIVLESDSSPLTEQVTQVHSTVIPEVGSQLKPNCEPYVPTGSLERASTSSISSLSNCDAKPFDPKKFHDKVCCYTCGRPGHIARHCLHRPTEFFYGRNEKVTPKMAELQFVPDHNMLAYLGDPPEKHVTFNSMVDGLILAQSNKPSWTIHLSSPLSSMTSGTASLRKRTPIGT